jgi:hypothetical protein
MTTNDLAERGKYAASAGGKGAEKNDVQKASMIKIEIRCLMNRDTVRVVI